MPQIFHHSTNFLAKLSIFGAIFILLAAMWVLAEINRSSYNTGQYIERQQPVQFSHKHHVGDDGIDCRYCHTSVESSAYAGLPSTDTCMTCHSQIWKDAPMLEPARASLASNSPLQWNRVHDLPDYVYFNHSIHVAKGIGCSTCHGRVDQMPLIRKTQTLYMRWCLECHRAPQNYIRPRDKIYDLAWQPSMDRPGEGERLVEQNHVDTSGRLTNCSTCHR